MLKYKIAMMRMITIEHHLFAIFCSLIFAAVLTGCNQKNNDVLANAAIHFSGVFIPQYVTSLPSLRVKGQPVVINTGDTIFNVKGSLEGLTSFNVPVSIKHFSDILHFAGGDPGKVENWKCMNIRVDEGR